MANSQKNIVYKISLLGDSQVGKTSIFKKMYTGDFSISVATIGVEKRTFFFNDIDVDIKGKQEKRSFEIHIFDTAGQERYRSLAPNYIKGSDGVILIYDITKKESFDHVEEWLSSVKEIIADLNKNDYLIMILGNKLDLLKENENLREVSIEEVKKKYENSNIILGGEVSAKDFSDEQLLDIIKNFTITLFNKIGENNAVKRHDSTPLDKDKIKNNNKNKNDSKKCC